MSYEPTTEAGKALGQRLARYYPPEEFEDWDAWVAKAENEAREQGAREERKRADRLAEALHGALSSLENSGWLADDIRRQYAVEIAEWQSRLPTADDVYGILADPDEPTDAP